MICRAGILSLCFAVGIGRAEALPLMFQSIPGAIGTSAIRVAADPTPLSDHAHSAREQVSAGNPLWVVPLSTLALTREQPIFSPSRRRPPTSPPVAAPAKVVVQPVKPDTPPLDIVGIVVGQQERIAVFLDRTTKASFRLRMGEGRGGWTLTSVSAREVTLQKENMATTLALPRAETKVGTAPSPSPLQDSVPNTKSIASHLKPATGPHAVSEGH